MGTRRRPSLSRARRDEQRTERTRRATSRLVSTGRTTSITMVAVGDRFPAVIAQSHEPSWPTPVKMQDRLKGKKTLVVGLPGFHAHVIHVSSPGISRGTGSIEERGDRRSVGRVRQRRRRHGGVGEGSKDRGK